MFRIRNRHIAGFTAMLALSLATGACGDDPMVMDEEEEPEVAIMRLTVGTQTIDVGETGTVTGGPIAIPVGSTAVSVVWLKADGTPEDIVDDVEFQLNVDSNNTSVVTFSRTDAFSGSLVGVGAGSTTLDFSLFHKLEMHEDFGPFPVSVTVS